VYRLPKSTERFFVASVLVLSVYESLPMSDTTMTSYHDDQQPQKHHHHHHNDYQQQSFFDELHHDTATPLPDLCPRDLHTGSTDDYFRLSDDGGVGGRVCAGCMVPIRDRHYLSAVGNNWHVSCLVCCECRQPLDRQSTCYVHDARIYCRDDYFALVNSHSLSHSALVVEYQLTGWG